MIKLPRLLRPKRRDAASAQPFFDAEFYRTEYPDVAAGGMDPLLHYLDHGWREGRNPSAVFATLYYADRHLPDGVPENPLLHYARLSAPERLRVPTRPGPDVVALQAEVIAPYFDARFYARVAGLEEGGEDPLQHYLTKGWRRGLSPNEAFDGTAYLQAHAHVRRLDVSPFYHLVSTRRLNPSAENLPERRGTGAAVRLPADPADATDAQVYEAVAAEFDKAYYLDRNADIRHSGVDPIRHFLDFGVREDRDPNPHFSIRFYRSQYRREIAPGVNPFFHYLAVGRERGFKPNAYGRGPWPTQVAPSEDEWAQARAAADLAGASVVLIMPVYKGRDDTLRAIHAVLSARQATSFALLVIDDSSPEPALSAALAQLAGRGLFVLERNSENLGFVRTCNRGLELAGCRDVVLLNADIVVFGDWLDRLLRHAADDSRIATVTPFSNNATICSYPVFCIDNQAQLEIGPAEIDAYAKVCNAGTRSPVPTGVGFCFYMRRAVIDAVGPLDAETFGRGYGEENDFCMRALKAGFANVLAHDVFVFHSGSVSFGALIATKGADIFRTVLTKHADYQRRIETHIQVDPARFARRRLDHYRFARRATAAAGRRVALIVTHDFGGGIETHVEAMSARLAEAGLDAVYLRTDELTGLRADLPEASGIDFPASVLEPISLAHEIDFVAELIAWLDPALVHVHSLVGLDWSSTLALMDLIAGLPTGYDATLHDYSAVCHRNHLVRPEGVYCGLPAPSVCRTCIRLDDEPETPPPDPEARHQAWAGFLRSARRVYAPSHDLAARIGGVLGLDHITLRPHEDRVPEPPPRPSRRRDGPLRVAVIGSIGIHKGFDVVHDLALDAQLRDLPIAYTLIGHSSVPKVMQAVGVQETGPYDGAAAAFAELARLDPDLILLPSIWPETYCYTLSLALAARVPPAVFDFGAQAERLAELGQGFRLDPALIGDPQRLNAALLALPLDALRAEQPAFRPTVYPRILEDYYGLPGRDSAEARAGAEREPA
ncbi:glycosyl transferase [Methylobacterium sp. Leaf456]|uniref:glycosyltransferase family 2 protein n=1 Tax=Methylobacterium sp. Leaf456 TaxID=1736382 RepID=UPI0006FEFF80|nr:glycosyltransferase [Methylobacterium sp. Leaf456]KQT47929.1 glycosyl transferase [Methylobacterium sp. Leaf456]